MARKNPRTAVVSFKAEPELAELLNQLPNKSEVERLEVRQSATKRPAVPTSIRTYPR